MNPALLALIRQMHAAFKSLLDDTAKFRTHEWLDGYKHGQLAATIVVLHQATNPDAPPADSNPLDDHSEPSVIVEPAAPVAANNTRAKSTHRFSPELSKS